MPKLRVTMSPATSPVMSPMPRGPTHDPVTFWPSCFNVHSLGRGLPAIVASSVHLPDWSDAPVPRLPPRPFDGEAGGAGGSGGFRSGFSVAAAVVSVATSFGCCIGEVTLIHWPGRSDFNDW